MRLCDDALIGYPNRWIDKTVAIAGSVFHEFLYILSVLRCMIMEGKMDGQDNCDVWISL